MIVKRFFAENFRNIEKCDIEFSEGTNLLLGENAQGKTNAAEGIYLFASGRSFRKSEDKDLVRFGSEGFRIGIDYCDKKGEGSLEYAVFGREKRRKVNGYKTNRISEMIGLFKSVLFYPDHLSLVKGGPEERRAFLNTAISQINPAYIGFYSDYKKALENRNFLLKLSSKGMYVNESEIIAWSESLAEYASFIYVLRKEYIEKIKKYCFDIERDISDKKENLSLFYKSDIEEGYSEREDIKKLYIKKFNEEINREKAAGVTLFGPHREDVEFLINGKSARSFASQGQQRSIVLALKMAEGEVSREISGEYPVFIFDDVLSELDEKRQSFVLSGNKDKQIIITSCDENNKNINPNKTIRVKGGIFT